MSRSARIRCRDRRRPPWIEALEGRQLLSVSSPSPTDGNDYHLIAAPGTRDAAASVRTHEKALFAKRPLPGGFRWIDGTPNDVLSDAPNTKFAISMIDSYSMWPWTPQHGVDKSGPTSEANTRRFAREAATRTNLVILDIEDWQMDIRGGTHAEVNENIRKYREVLGWIRDERPQLKLGVYGYMSMSDNNAVAWDQAAPMASIGDPWHVDHLPQASDLLGEWQAMSEFMRPLSKSVDYLFPSLHTGGADQDFWAVNAKATIADSRRYGKPVFPLICPTYHPAAGALGHQYIAPDFWQKQLDLVQAEADGVLLWTGPGADASAPWFSMTMNAAAASGSAYPSMAAAASLPPAAIAREPVASRLSGDAIDAGHFRDSSERGIGSLLDDALLY